VIRAVLWDFGGVILSSPFEAFRRYEAEHEIPLDFIRGVNATNPDVNAWARLERAELDHEGFDAAFAAESKALGHEVPGADVLALLSGDVRAEMVRALDGVIAAGYNTACLTNNVVESSKVGIRKPERGFYTRACELLGVEPPECVFLDDLGINLKPAKEMGMTTIKVGEPGPAIAELEGVLGISLH
jgi:putative hydrolase of the HAD superfamily